MSKSIVAFPVLPGMETAALNELPQYCRDHMDEYTESRRNAGITMERVYDMDTPMGKLNILYAESDSDFSGSVMKLATSGKAFDAYFLGKLHEITGVDFTQPPPGPGPELLGEWWDPAVTERRAGLAFCAPLAAGRTDAGRAFAKEVWGVRKEELAESRRATGITGEVVVLNTTPMGDLVCVYLEGNDPAAGNREFAASQTPFDRWFKDECKGIFPPEISFDDPVPPVTQIFEWMEVAVPTA
ncbi:MAG: hypothetical protein QOE92_2157 [Chloroflexota bacterium]|jgi:hypothetical protein|nr:hypothetical protein [Chloroflexota bacterium]